MADRDAESPHWWAKVLGLVPTPMFGSTRTRSLSRYYAVLLDGEKASFALTSGDAGSVLKEPQPLDYAWSSNLTYTLIVDKAQDKLFIHRWDKPDQPEDYRLPTADTAPEILDRLAGSASPPAEASVIQRMLRLFRVVRSNVVGQFGGTSTDVVQAFDALLVGTDAARRGLISTGEWDKARSLHDVLRLIETKRLAKLGVSSVSSQVHDFEVHNLIEDLFGRDKDAKRLLDPDLLIRHAAGELYQDLHIELFKASSSPAPQKMLPGFASLDDSPPKGAPKSDVHFTPTPLARLLVEHAVKALLSLRNLPSQVEALDPACGSGVFLHEAWREFAEWGRGLNLRGIDSSPAACAMTKFCLEKATEDAPNEQTTTAVEVRQLDSLATGALWGNPDMILMNPPFVAWEEMTRDERRQARDVLGGYYHGRADKALAFISKAIGSLKPGGVLATLAPASLLESKYGQKFRAAVEADRTMAIHLVGHFRGFGYFRAANVEPVFLVVSRSSDASRQRPPVRVILADSGYEDTAIRESRRQPDHDIIDAAGRWEVFLADPVDFTSSSWMPKSRLKAPLIEALSHTGVPRVGDLFDVKLSIRTGDNPVFILPAAQLDALHPSQEERSLFRPVAGNSTIRDGRILPGTYVFYPYDTRGRPLFKTEDELERGAPQYYHARLKPQQERLVARDSIRQRGWWELAEPRPTWQPRPRPKIVSALFADRGSFAYDETGLCCVVQGVAWLWKNKRSRATHLAWAYLALLNSPVFERLLAMSCRQVGGGQFEIYPAPLKRVFLPDLSNEKRVFREILDRLAALGQSIAQGQPPSPESLDEAAASAYGFPLRVLRGEESLEEYLQGLVRRWKRERRPTSSATKMAAHPAYREIIRMGMAAVPFLLAELIREPDHWFVALHEITGADPVPKESRGRLREMAEAWVRWGKEHASPK